MVLTAGVQDANHYLPVQIMIYKMNLIKLKLSKPNVQF